MHSSYFNDHSFFVDHPLIDYLHLQAVEYKSKIRGCIKIPTLLGPAPCIDDWGHVPAISELGLTKEKVFHL